MWFTKKQLQLLFWRLFLKNPYLSNTMDENLLGLLSRGIRHFKRFSKITKHSHADAIHITADKLVEKDAVWLIHRRQSHFPLHV